MRRSLSLTSLTPTPDSAATTSGYNGFGGGAEGREGAEEDRVVLKTEYRATTNRMLRVAVNGFMESLAVVVGVMGELDADVLALERGEGA